MATVVLNDQKSVSAAVREELAAVDADLVQRTARTADALADALAETGADALIPDSGTPVTAEVLEAADLDAVGRAGIGVDNIDLDAAAAAGTTVVHVPDYCLDEVSTHALSLLLACVRRTFVYDRQTRSGGWDWSAGRPVHRMSGHTLGLVGVGAIARQLVEKVGGFNLDIVAYDPYVDAEAFPAGVEKVGHDALFDRADYVSVHAPLTDETRGLVDAAALDALGEGVLVNTARGPIVDQNALHEALADGDLDAAGLDVMAEEPPGDSPLLDRDDVVVTPHTAWYSEESMAEVSRSVAADVARVLAGEPPENPVAAERGW
jgi:D-3-phosphoglycerate dehydrogenase